MAVLYLHPMTKNSVSTSICATIFILVETGGAFPSVVSASALAWCCGVSKGCAAATTTGHRYQERDWRILGALVTNSDKNRLRGCVLDVDVRGGGGSLICWGRRAVLHSRPNCVGIQEVNQMQDAAAPQGWNGESCDTPLTCRPRDLTTPTMILGWYREYL
ncbi:hypothetical protein F4802DRAFT_45576 [Xylaria palmicola]|nr:hypothetical protein F4802DRAFT_45576 [Xylaria palmicola]